MNLVVIMSSVSLLNGLQRARLRKKWGFLLKMHSLECWLFLYVHKVTSVKLPKLRCLPIMWWSNGSGTPCCDVVLFFFTPTVSLLETNLVFLEEDEEWQPKKRLFAPMGQQWPNPDKPLLDFDKDNNNPTQTPPLRHNHPELCCEGGQRAFRISPQDTVI